MPLRLYVAIMFHVLLAFEVEMIYMGTKRVCVTGLMPYLPYHNQTYQTTLIEYRGAVLSVIRDIVDASVHDRQSPISSHKVWIGRGMKCNSVPNPTTGGSSVAVHIDIYTRKLSHPQRGCQW